MKKLSLIIMAFATISIIWVSCAKEEVKEFKKRYVPKDFEFVGIEHNKMLSKTFDFISQNKEEIRDVSQIETFLVENMYTTDNDTPETIEFGQSETRRIFGDIESFMSSYSNENNSRGVDEPYDPYLIRLIEILTFESFDESDLILEKITNLENEVSLDNVLNNDHLLVLFSASQTAKHSYNYWTINLQDWVELGGVSDGSSVGGEIVKGDVIGGVAGATGALVVNVVPGLGQAAYGTAIVGAGVAASAGVALYALFDYFGW